MDYYYIKKVFSCKAAEIQLLVFFGGAYNQ